MTSRTTLVGFALLLGACTAASSGSEQADTEQSDTGQSDTEESSTGDCAFDEVLALRSDSDGRVWIAAGDQEIALDEGYEPPVGGWHGDQVEFLTAGSRTHVAIARNRIPAGDSTSTSTVLHVFRSTGEFEWMYEFPTDVVNYVRTLWIDDEGVVTIAAEYLVADEDMAHPAAFVGYVGADGELTQLPNHRILAPADESWVLAARDNGDHDLWGWLAIADQAWISGLADYLGRIDGQAIEFIDSTPGAPQYVRLTRTQMLSVPLPTDPDPLALVITERAGPYRLLGMWNDLTKLVRVDIESGEVIVFEPGLPPGWGPLPCPVTFLEASGQLTQALHDQSSIRLWTHEPEQGVWTPQGRPHAQVASFTYLSEQGDLNIVSARSAPHPTCAVELDDTNIPADAVLGDATQVVRFADRFSTVLPVGYWVPPVFADDFDLPDIPRPEIDATQRCIAYTDKDGLDNWWVRELDGSEEQQFGERAGWWTWLD